jgi:hypothetical protein
MTDAERDRSYCLIRAGKSLHSGRFGAPLAGWQRFGSKREPLTVGHAFHWKTDALFAA